MIRIQVLIERILAEQDVDIVFLGQYQLEHRFYLLERQIRMVLDQRQIHVFLDGLRGALLHHLQRPLQRAVLHVHPLDHVGH